MPVDSHNRWLCQICEQELPYIPSDGCEHCGLPYPSQRLQLCPDCHSTPPPWHKLIAAMYYTLESKYLITQLKFAHQIQIGHLLGQLLADKVRQQILQQVIEKPQGILCIPLHKKRLRQRHYNQSYIIAKELSKALNIPLISSKTFIRVKQTQQQAQLDMSARAANIAGAFRLTKALNVKHIAVVDDVVTTGETMKEACKLLSANGVETIDIWCVARTLAD